MEFNLLNEVFPKGFDYSYILIIISTIVLLLVVITILQMIQMNKLKKKYKKFMSGKDAGNLEKQFIKLFEDNKYLIDLSETNKKDIRQIKHEMETSFNKMGIVRYDAFQHMGGMMSFCIAFLNRKNNGCILNSVHSTEGCYTYIKEINEGTCKIELSNEEKEALATAMKEG